MKLSYRGVSYDREKPFLEIQEGEIAGKYRGQEWKYHYPRHIPPAPPKLYRQYRGVAYSTCPNLSQDSACQITDSAEQIGSVPRCQVKPIIKNQISQIHLENMRRNLERRIKVAEANGDDDLVNLLKKESEQLTI